MFAKPADGPDVPDEPIDQGPVEPDYSDRVEPDPVVEPEGMAAIFEEYPDVYAWLHIPNTAEALAGVLYGKINAEGIWPVEYHA